MTTDEIQAGVIGVGSMGRHHARVYDELTGIELAGVADVDRARAREIATENGTRAVDRQELLKTVDVVSVAVPTQHHYDVARDCIDNEVDVLVEKPLVRRPKRGRSLVSLANDAGVTLQVGHIERFNPAVEVIEELVDDLDVIAVEAERLGPPPDRKIDDSAVLDLMLHDIDILLELVDSDITSLSAVGARDGQYANANIQFENEVVGRLTSSRVTQRRVRRLSITAASRVIIVDYTEQSVRIHRHALPEYVENDGDISYRQESVIEQPAIQSVEPLKRELESFVRTATTGEEPVVTGEDGLRVLRVARAIERGLTEDATEPQPPLVEVGVQ